MCVRRGGVCHSADGTDDTVQSGMCEAGGEGGRDECGIHKQPLHLLLCLDDDSLEGSYCGAKDHEHSQPDQRHTATTYLHSSLHLGGLVTFSLPQGTVSLVALHLQETSTVRTQG